MAQINRVQLSDCLSNIGHHCFLKWHMSFRLATGSLKVECACVRACVRAWCVRMCVLLLALVLAITYSSTRKSQTFTTACYNKARNSIYQCLATAVFTNSLLRSTKSFLPAHPSGRILYQCSHLATLYHQPSCHSCAD